MAMYLLEAPPKPVGEKRVVFRDLEWSSFKQIQHLLTERTHALFTYDNGVLEITMSLESHERFARLTRAFHLDSSRRDGSWHEDYGVNNAGSRRPTQKC